MWQVTARGRRYDLAWLVPASQPAGRRSAIRGAPERRRRVLQRVIRIYPSRGVGVAVMGNATSYHA